MYASTLPELAGQTFNDIAEATLSIDGNLGNPFEKSWVWYSMLPSKKRAHVCLEWIVAV